MPRTPPPTGAMHVAQIRTVHGDKVYESYLIRSSYRQDGKVKHRNVANITLLPIEVIDVIRRSLRGETVVPPSELSPAHGEVDSLA